jgi:hypothetical protein
MTENSAELKSSKKQLFVHFFTWDVISIANLLLPLFQSPDLQMFHQLLVNK